MSETGQPPGGRAVCKVEPRPKEACKIEKPGPGCIVIFGATGDLSKRKLVPSLYRLFADELLPDEFLILGVSRTQMDDDGFRKIMEDAVGRALPEKFSSGAWEKFSVRLFYEAAADLNSEEFFRRLPSRLGPLEKKFGTSGNRIFYMAIPPSVYETVIRHLGTTGLSSEENRYSRIVVEKPFGYDISSSRHLNSVIAESFTEAQTFRMDHYLAKENVQNILMFRFANSIFEPLWNRRYIDHVEITISETLGVGHRADYYEGAGVLRDMFQNHILQLLSLTAMEPPAVFASDRLRDEKAKVLRSIRPIPLDKLDEYVALGQYGAGTLDEKGVPAYRDEPGVDKKSKTATYGAMKLYIDNWRWSGVPFYMRSGKRLSTAKAEIAIQYRAVPHLMFSQLLPERIDPSVLVLRVQPEEGISLQFQTKMPESRACLQPVLMDFKYEKVFLLDAYERVLLDCMTGDQMLFVSGEIEELTWGLLTPVLERLDGMKGKLNFPNYAAGTVGPREAEELIARDGRQWRALDKL
jgi:glucose-6-phosphate 1-dehydrogenase